MSLLELFCHVDDFWKEFHNDWYRQLLAQQSIKRVRQSQLSESEIMTIIIHFHQSGYRDFKSYYTKHVIPNLQAEFPQLVSYPRFVALMPRVLIPLWMYLYQCMGTCTGISFIDATRICVCRNKRISRNKVFEGIVARGKSTLGWFFGFKLHLIVNDSGDLLAFHLTPGNVDDRQPVPAMSKNIFGKLVGDKGYISKKLFDELWQKGVQLITAVRKNMKNRLVIMEDKLLLRKRSIIETINDQLKNISQIEHSRHRSVSNFMVNLLAGLIAYCHQPKKPSINWSSGQVKLLATIM